jgi:hypothetical protein
MRPFRYGLAIVSLSLSLGVATTAAAQTQTAIAAGHVELVNGTRNGTAPNNNFVTGGAPGGPSYRSFISFSVPAGANYTAAELRLNASTVAGGPNDLEVFDVNTDVATDPVATVYNDLGSGVLFGTATGLTTGSSVVVLLNPQGIAAINAAGGGTITFGLINATQGGGADTIFGLSENSTPRSLFLTAAPPPAPVPTLSEWAMIVLALMLSGGATIYLQRRRQTA